MLLVLGASPFGLPTPPPMGEWTINLGEAELRSQVRPFRVVQLPAASSEDVEVPVLSWEGVNPGALSWEGSVSSGAPIWPGPAPADAAFGAADVVNRGTDDSPDWRVKLRVSGLSSGTYGMWVRVADLPGTSPVRFAGLLILY